MIIDKKAKEVEEIKNVFQELLPQLESVYNLAAEKPKVRYYEGFEGVRAMRLEFLETDAKEVYGFTAIDPLFKFFPEENLTKERVAKGIKSRVLYTTQKGPVESATNTKFLREARYLPQDKFKFTTDISIYSNRISMVFLKEKLGGVIIESQELADMMCAIFELAWEGAERYQK